MKVCTAEGCEREIRALGLCSMHYQRTLHSGRSNKNRTKSPIARDSPDSQFIIQKAERMSARDIAEHLGISTSSVYYRMKILGVALRGGGGNKFNPQSVGKRVLVAKSCTGCGLLKDAAEFTLQKGVFRTKCRFCDSEACSLYMNKDPARKADALAQLHKNLEVVQRKTRSDATRSGFPYIEEDFKVLQDPLLSLEEKSVRLKRSYKAVSTICEKNGWTSKGSRLKSRHFAMWSIDNPNQK